MDDYRDQDQAERDSDQAEIDRLLAVVRRINDLPISGDYVKQVRQAASEALQPQASKRRRR